MSCAAVRDTILRTTLVISAMASMASFTSVELRAAQPRVVVRLIDTSGNLTNDRTAAMRVTSRILATPGLALEWRDCSPGPDRRDCDDARDRGELVVRIMRQQLHPAGRYGGGASKSAVASGEGQHLGFAALDPATRRGVLATIYHDRVLSVAQRARIGYTRLLGRAIAHELGHLLLRAPGHGTTGLMRAVWTDEEITRDSRADWYFAPPDEQQLQRLTSDPRREMREAIGSD